MSDATFQIFFEIYLLASSTFLFLALLNTKVRDAMRPLERLRPISETQSKILKIVLLIVFVPLTIYNTLGLLGVYTVNSK